MVGLSLLSAIDYFVGVLEEDRPPCREAPPPACLHPQPAQEAQRCPRNLSRRARKSFRAAEYSPAERTVLLRLAHQSIEAALEERHLDLSPPSQHLAEYRGAFTTLRHHGRLRGCIGYVFPLSPSTNRSRNGPGCRLRRPAFRGGQFGRGVDRDQSKSASCRRFAVAAEDVLLGQHGLVYPGSRRGLLLRKFDRWDWDASLSGPTC